MEWNSNCMKLLLTIRMGFPILSIRQDERQIKVSFKKLNGIYVQII